MDNAEKALAILETSGRALTLVSGDVAAIMEIVGLIKSAYEHLFLDKGDFKLEDFQARINALVPFNLDE